MAGAGGLHISEELVVGSTQVTTQVTTPVCLMCDCMRRFLWNRGYSGGGPA